MASSLQAAKRAQQNKSIQKCKEYTFSGRCEKAFQVYCIEGEDYMNHYDIRNYLSEVLMVDKSEISSECVQFAIDIAKYDNETKISEHAIQDVVKAYGGYLQKKEEVDKLYTEFDTNKDDELDRKELMNLLQALETNKRKKNALTISDDDITLILSQCDVERDDKISKLEVLTALKVWELLAELHLEENQTSCSCSIL